MLLPITLAAPAKINLGLLVKDERPDGYHDIETIMVALSLFDELTLEPVERGIELVTGGRPVPAGKKNLVYTAAELFFQNSGIRDGVRITLTKSIPVGAGLGGGSSDSAATLIGLNRLYNSPLATGQLLEIAVRLGMDVPFFLSGKASYATGRGERLETIDVPDLSVFLHTPNYPISTRWAYQNLAPASDRIELTKQSQSVIVLRQKLETGDVTALQPYIVNSFEELVFGHHPDLRMVKEFFLRQQVVAASLSGTGSTVYALVTGGAERTLDWALRNAGIDFMTAKIVKQFGASSSGRTQDFGSCWGGSNPPAPVNYT